MHFLLTNQTKNRMKQFYKYTLTLVAILIATSNAWATATCHTPTKLQFETDASYQTGKYIKTTHYYYSTPKQTFVTITDNSYNTFSNISCKVTGDTQNGEQKFKIIYKTSSSESWNEVNTEYILNRKWVSTSLIYGYYEAGYTDINLLSLPNNTTEIGIYFTNYNSNSNSNKDDKRTITISDVSVSFSNYFSSSANGTTLDAFPSTEKDRTCTTTRTFNYQYNNTITSVDWKSSNPMFTISSTHTEDCSGEGTVTISFTPTEISQEIKGTITGTANTEQTITVYVVGSSWGKSDPTYQWNSSIWNNKNQTKTIYVGETINNIVSSDSKAECTYNIEYIEGGGTNNGDSQTTFTNNTLVAGRAGKYKLIISQPEHKMSETSIYNAGYDEIYVTINKHSIEANIAQTTAVWNELIDNAFTLTDNLTDYKVESKNPTIAQYLVGNKIQTYYTTGSANFQITRPEDRKYKALNQELTLSVNQNTNGCNLTLSDYSTETGTGDDSTSDIVILYGEGDLLSFNYKLNNNANTSHYLTTQYSTADTGSDFHDISQVGEEDTKLLSHSLQLPDGTKRIRFKRTDNGWGDKKFVISNITVTRKQYITPSVAEGATLTLPTVAINQDCSATFDLSWSTCSSIAIESSNSKFTVVTPSQMSNTDGTQTITVQCNTSEVGTYNGIITIYDQSSKKSFNVTATVNDKWTPVMTGQESYSKFIGNTWGADFAFQNTETEKPSADSNDPFYFEIVHQQFVNTDRSTRNPDHLDEIISYNQETNEITAHNAGTAVLTFIQKDTPGYYSGSRSCTITVAKHTPIFVWKDPVYFNQTIIPDYFETDNKETELIIESPSSDPEVAELYFSKTDATDKHTLDLTTYYKETTPASSTQVTVSQAENWKWYAHEETKTITPKNQDNHVEFTLTEGNYIRDFQVDYNDPYAGSNGPNWSDGGIRFGKSDVTDGGWNWNDKYIIIEFTGVPDSLKFSTTATSGTFDATTGTESDLFFYVSEGKRNTNGEIVYTQTWEYKSADNNVSQKLNPDTRILKLCYTGNLEGWFKNVRITELNEFEAKVEGQDETTIDTLDFDVVHITDKTEKTMVFNFKYANAGYKVSLDLDQTGGWAEEEAYQEAKKYIEITPPLIDTIGGEKYGEVNNIQVTFHSDDQSTYTIPEDARLKIADEAGHITYVYLKGEIVCTEDQIDWNAYFSLQEPIQIPLSTDSIYNAANTDKYSKLPLKYRSASNGSIIKVSPNGKCFIPAGIGKDTIYAYHDGNNKVCPVESMKIVVVTEKSIQLIDWRDDLSDLIFGSDDNITLTAKVYIIDVVNNTFEYSPEQTANLVYTVADEGESVVSIEEGTTTLKVNGLGETNLTVTIAPNDSLEGATMTIPVVVREPAIGCEDILLLDHTAQIEFFQMNTNQITKDAIALDRTKGIPGYLLFQHKGEKWASIFYKGSIKAQQSTDGGTSWADVPGSTITPIVGTFHQTDSLPLDQNATHIRFIRPSDGQGHHFVKDIKVAPAQYIETSTNSLNFEKINMGGTYSKTITISYSNIKSPIINSTSSNDITITPASFGECSGFGTQEVTIKWNPNTKENQYIIFKDTLINLSVRVDLIAEIDGRKQAIVWNNRTGAIHDYTDIDNRPTHTIDYNNQQPLDHPITYEVKAGNAAFENGIFFIKGTGEITIHAYHDGNDAYQRVDSFYQFNVPYMPPTFLNTEGDSLWTTEANWANNYVPDTTQTAVILAPLVIRDHKIINQLLVSDEGSVHITSTGGLTVGEGGIQCSKTDGSAIVIDNLYSGAGFLRVDPTYEGTMPRITMRYQTRSTLDNGANKEADWQYIGAPGKEATVYVDYGTWLYKHDEASADWIAEERMTSAQLEPFKGYSITQYGQPTYEWTAELTTENCTIPLTYHKNGRDGRHIIANSYTAPINVAAFTGNEFQYLDGMSSKYRIDQTLYIFNSGSWNDWNKNGQTTNGSSAGQYYAIPVKAAAEDYLEGEQTTIAPMQGIYLRVRSKTPLDQLPESGDTVGNLILNYNQIVMDNGGSTHEMNRPMRSPAMQDPNFRRVRIVATSENSGTDRVYIIQDNINTNKFNNGYDATNQETKGLVNIYTNESGGKMEVSCSNNIDSMYIGFMAGSDHTYTLHFSAIIGDILYLQDLDNGQKISIVEGGSYTFEAEPQSTNNKRFLLLASQNTTTDLDIIEPANIWYSNQTLYIANAPYNSVLTLYNISGQPILSTTIHHTPYTIDLSHLANGVYMARLNNQIYKFVCK